MLALRSFSESHLEDLVGLQQYIFPITKHWSIEEARNQLMDLARNGGSNVLEVIEGDVVKGFIGWVSNSETREFYGSPFVALTEDAARLLMEQLLIKAQALNAAFVRVSAYQFESEKKLAFLKLNFYKKFDFIDLEISLENWEQSNLPALNYQIIKSTEVDYIKYRDLCNKAFLNVENSPPISEELSRELWQSSMLHQDLSCVLTDDEGNYVAFMIVFKDGYIDSIGVLPSLHGRKIGSALYEMLFSRAKELNCFNLHSTIASNNQGSLSLHEKFGFSETGRREVWQFDL